MDVGIVQYAYCRFGTATRKLVFVYSSVSTFLAWVTQLLVLDIVMQQSGVINMSLNARKSVCTL